MGWQTIGFVEIDKFCQAVLRKHWPGVQIESDIKSITSDTFRERPDIVTGGFPCQPFSENGRRRGKHDARYLWPEMLRVVEAIKPTYVVSENVSGSWVILDEICSSMESLGYTAEPCSIEAACIGADHLRERHWIVSYPESHGDYQRSESHSPKGSPERPYIIRECARRLTGTDHEYAQSCICRIADGIPRRVDRLRSLGNAIVPQVAYEIFRAIALT